MEEELLLLSCRAFSNLDLSKSAPLLLHTTFVLVLVLLLLLIRPPRVLSPPPPSTPPPPPPPPPAVPVSSSAIAIPSSNIIDPASTETTTEPLCSLNWDTLTCVTPLHLFTFNFTRLGHPSPTALTPVSEMGQFLMQSFFKAVNLEAMTASSESPTVSVLQIAIRSSTGQLEANILKEPTVTGIPIRTTSWRFEHLVAMDNTPSSPIVLLPNLLHASICSFLSFLQELAMADTPSSVQSEALLRYRTSRSGQEAEMATRPGSPICTFSI